MNKKLNTNKYSKCLWNTVKEICNETMTGSEIEAIITETKDEIIDISELANVFNEYFSKVAVKLSNNMKN